MTNLSLESFRAEGFTKIHLPMSRSGEGVRKFILKFHIKRGISINNRGSDDSPVIKAEIYPFLIVLRKFNSMLLTYLLIYLLT